MPSDEAGGQPEGWTQEEKKRGAAGGASGGDAGKAGEPDPKAKTTDDRAATEAAAANIEKDKTEGQPS